MVKWSLSSCSFCFHGVLILSSILFLWITSHHILLNNRQAASAFLKLHSSTSSDLVCWCVASLRSTLPVNLLQYQLRRKVETLFAICEIFPRTFHHLAGVLLTWVSHHSGKCSRKTHLSSCNTTQHWHRRQSPCFIVGLSWVCLYKKRGETLTFQTLDQLLTLTYLTAAAL